ncbi:MAG: AAA family ATPase [Methylophagaceae bacterium]
MRIHFKKIKYKNILSTGNTFTTSDFDSYATTLVSGSNGSGKSTLLDAMTFGLYGKPFRNISKSQLLNSINKKGLEVELYFAAGGNNYLIRRCMKPNVFEIFKDGEMLNQNAAKKDYQQHLEENILGINYKSFNQIVVLGSATYVPFMELRVGQRREIIEDLLDIQVFSVMNLLAKDKINENKAAINDTKYNIELVETKISSAEENNNEIRKIKETQVDQIRDKMSGHIDEIESRNSTIDTQDEIMKALYDDISDKADEKQKFADATQHRNELDRSRVQLEKELSFYEHNDDCPTCKQGIAHDFKSGQVNEKLDIKAGIEQGLVSAAETIKTHQDRLGSISKVEEQIQSVNFKISEIRAEIKMSKNALVSYKKELEGAQREVEEVDTSKLQSLQEDLSKQNDIHQAFVEDREILSVVHTILKDGGIKARIISQYIPVMNKLINKYLAAFDLFVDFHLDEEFNEVIRSRFRDNFTYASFSEGEKLRITLSIMLAWRAVAKLRNSVSTNLLILDETLDGALDSVGIESLIETLHGLNSDDNIFVISHRGDQFAEKFDGSITFGKVKNFSEIIG